MKVIPLLFVIAAFSFFSSPVFGEDEMLISLDFSTGDEPTEMKKFKGPENVIEVIPPQDSVPGYLSLKGSPESGWKPGVTFPILNPEAKGWLKITMVFRQASADAGGQIRLRDSVNQVDWFGVGLNSAKIQSPNFKGIKLVENAFGSGPESPWVTFEVYVPLEEGNTEGLAKVDDLVQPVEFKLPEGPVGFDLVIIAAPGETSDFQVQTLKVSTMTELPTQ